MKVILGFALLLSFGVMADVNTSEAESQPNEPVFIKCFTHCGATQNWLERVEPDMCSRIRLQAGCFCGTNQEIAQMMQVYCR